MMTEMNEEEDEQQQNEGSPVQMLSALDRMAKPNKRKQIISIANILSNKSFLWILGLGLFLSGLYNNLFKLPHVITQNFGSTSTTYSTTSSITWEAAAGGEGKFLGDRKKSTKNSTQQIKDDVINTWLGDYIKFHQNSLEYDSTNHTYKVKESTNNKYLIYYCAGHCGGVGDRIKGIFSALYLSICTNRVLLVDAKSPDDLANYLEPQAIKWNAIPPKDYVDDKFVWLDMIDAPYHKMLKDPFVMKTDKQTASKRIIKLKVNTWRPIQFEESKCIQNFQNSTRRLDDISSQIYRHFFESLFDWSTNVQNRVQQYHQMAGMKQLLPSSSSPTTTTTTTTQKTPPYVGVHIRTGPKTAGFQDPPRHVGQESVFYECAKKFQSRLKDVCKTTVDDKPDIFIASDNKASKIKVQNMDPVSSVKYVDVDIVHVDKGGYRLQGDLKQLDIWSEMKMLSDSACLVYSRSGFSETAAWINDGCSIKFDDCTNQTLFEEALQKAKC